MTKPAQTIRKIATGSSKAMPKARNMPSTKSRYAEMSVITATPVGATEMKNPNTTGNTA